MLLKDILSLTLTLGWKNEKWTSGPIELDLEAGNLVCPNYLRPYQARPFRSLPSERFNFNSAMLFLNHTQFIQVHPTHLGEPYLAQCHNIKNDGWRPLNVWLCLTWWSQSTTPAITAPDDSSVQAPDVTSLSPLEASLWILVYKLSFVKFYKTQLFRYIKLSPQPILNILMIM